MMSSKAVGVVARYTLLEAARTRLPWTALAVVVTALVIAECAAGLALTESQSFRVEIYAAVARLALAVLTMLFVASSVTRELADRVIDLTLSRPVSRSAWFVGRLLGQVGAAAMLGLAAAVPLAITSTPPAALAWGMSLAAELALVAAASLSAAVALTQLTVAVLAVGAFYALARMMGAIVLMSRGPAVDASASSSIIAQLVEWLARLLPALDDYARSSWLTEGGAALSALPAIAVQTLIYLVLLAAVGLFDFTRREI